MSEFEPGTVALATVRGVPNVRVFRLGTGTWVTAEAVETRFHHGEVTDVRPLVVIDPEDHEQMHRLAEAWDEIESGYAELLDKPWTMHAMRVRQAVRSLTRPPKPEEPTGLGAVVEDAEGERWVRYAPEGDTAPWVAHAVSVEYDDIDAVRVLSEGVQP